MRKTFCFLLISLMVISTIGFISADSTAIESENLMDLEIRSSGATYYVIWPTTSNIISSHFGPRWGVFHYGVDVAPANGMAGDPIWAIAAGKVVAAGVIGTYGNVVYLNSEIQVTYHGVEPDSVDDGLVATGDVQPTDVTITLLRQSRYAHLQRILVSTGNNVSQGRQLGTMGDTGNSTGVHLHLETRSISSLDQLNPPSSNAHNPLLFYPNMYFQSLGVFDIKGNFYDIEMLLELTPYEIDRLGISREKIKELISNEYFKELITEQEINALVDLTN